MRWQLVGLILRQPQGRRGEPAAWRGTGVARHGPGTLVGRSGRTCMAQAVSSPPGLEQPLGEDELAYKRGGAPTASARPSYNTKGERV